MDPNDGGVMRERLDKALLLFAQGYNCSQVVLAAYAELFGLSREQALKIACGFGGGIGGLRDTCGAVSAAVILAGLRYADANDPKSKQMVNGVVRNVVARFETINQTSKCDALLRRDRLLQEAKNDARLAGAGNIRPCAKYVADSIEIVESMLGGECEP